MATFQEQKLCAMCSHHSTQLCSGCRAMHYCSQNCQKKDWPTHKLVCKDYQPFLLTRPSTNHFSVIYFPPDEAKPRFAWLRFEKGHNHPHDISFAEMGLNGEWISNHENAISGEDTLLKRRYENHCIVLSQPPVEQICPCCNTDRKPNRSLMAYDSDLANHSTGAYVAWAMHHADDIVMNTADLDLNPLDFRHVIDQLQMSYWGWNDAVSEATLAAHGILGVRINCEGDKRFLDRSTFEETYCSKNSILEGTEIAAPIADKIGLPLRVHKIPSAKVWRDRAVDLDTRNFKAYLLNPPYQSTDTGTVVVFRKDAKPLHPLHVHALLEYTASKLLKPEDTEPEKIDMLTGTGFVKETTQLSKEDFQQFYLDMVRNSPARAGAVPSPFDVESDEEDVGVGIDNDQDTADNSD